MRMAMRESMILAGMDSCLVPEVSLCRYLFNGSGASLPIRGSPLHGQYSEQLC